MEANNLQALRENLLFQFDIAKQMLNYHLTDLGQEEYMWQAVPSSLHIQPKEGKWVADWPETESYEIGTPSIAWTMWHIIFWWKMVNDYSFGEGILTKEEVAPFSHVEQAKEEIDSLISQWEKTLTELSDQDLLSSAYTKWPFTDLPFYQLAGWLNLELMKNAAEIGQSRFQYATVK